MNQLRNIFFVAFITIISNLTIVANGQNIYCSNQYSCASSYLSGDDIFCWAFHSCDSCSGIESSAATIACRGSYGCYKSSSVIGYQPTCYGLLSCAYLSVLRSDGLGIQCWGEKSCYSSNIYQCQMMTIMLGQQ